MLRTCEDCRFWDNSVSALSDENTGRCIVRAPTLPAYSTGIGAWPFTSPDDSCGEHQPVKADRAASIETMAAMLEPFLAVADAMAEESAAMLIPLDLRDAEGEPIELSSIDFTNLAAAWEAVRRA